VKTARTILYYIWTGIVVVVLAFVYAFFTSVDNEELKKAEKKVRQKEKEVEKAKKKYDLKKEEVDIVRKETDKILANQEVEDVTEDQAKSAVERAVNANLDD